jgi:hypothetical protein
MRLFEQRHADAEHADAEGDSADQLAARSLGVQDVPGGGSAEIAADPNLAGSADRCGPLVPRGGRPRNLETVEAVSSEERRDANPQMRRFAHQHKAVLESANSFSFAESAAASSAGPTLAAVCEPPRAEPFPTTRSANG